MLEPSKTGISFSRCGDRLSAPAITRLMGAALDTPNLLSLAAGFTDNATLPVGPVRQVLDEILGRPGLPESLQYGTNQGRPILRELLAKRIGAQDRAEGAYDAYGMFITNGSQQALTLATQVLCDPGDIVLVEKPTYFVYLDVLRGLGAEARNLPLDGDNRLDPVELDRFLDRMERAGELGRLKAVYLQGYYANPSSRTLRENEKTGLADVLRRRGLFIPVVEDAAYRELFFDEPPEARSILALPEFDDFPRLYLGTLTKPFATGLKVGFGYCTSREWRDRILFLKGQHDFGTSNFAQAILEEVLEGGHLDEYLLELRKHYKLKMRALHDCLVEGGLPDEGWQWEAPAGGLYLWLRGPRGLDTGVDSFCCERGLANGVLYVPGNLCFGDEVKRHFVRLSFGVLGPDQLREAGRRFIRAVLETVHKGK